MVVIPLRLPPGVHQVMEGAPLEPGLNLFVGPGVLMVAIHRAESTEMMRFVEMDSGVWSCAHATIDAGSDRATPCVWPR